MKISKRKLKTLIREFMEPDAVQQDNNLSALPMMVNSISSNMLKNNKSTIEKMVNSLSEEDRSAIIEFKNLGINQQIELIKTSLSSRINESDKKDVHRKGMEQLSKDLSLGSETSLYNLLRGNPTGISHSGQLEKLSDQEINDLWNSTFHAKGIYQILIPLSLTGAGIGTMILPEIIVQLARTLNQTLRLFGMTNQVNVGMPYYGEAAFTLMMIGMIFAFHSMVVNQVRDSTIYKQGDRQAKEREISDYLYLDDKDMPLPGSGKSATAGRNIKMMIKNVFRFFTQ
tara:strand:- start:83 stop:937 length:855 start_codon:yes stop_codon:yes gene_type:complete